MPLTAKGKKLKKKFKEQYGKKKGESVFYAMENSGKLKKVIKARGGDAARAAAARGNMEGRADPSRGVDRSAVGAGSQYAKNVAAQQQKAAEQTKKTQAIKSTIFGPTPFISLNLMKNLVLDPITKKTRTQKAKGESLLGKPKALPATRDYYRTTGKPLDVMSTKGEKYMKDAGLIKPVQPPKVDTKGGQNLCPDGSLPPCKPTVTKAPTTTGSSSSSSFLKDFIFYPLKSGGVSSGPPPKRGPNPQVPPVKLSRGGGAAIRGTKFKGVF